MLVTPLAPALLAGAALFAVLLGAQLVLGSRAGTDLSRLRRSLRDLVYVRTSWPLVQGVQSLGYGVGAALAPPVIAQLMSAFDWQRALIWTTLPALALIAWWAWYARNTPAEHPARQRAGAGRARRHAGAADAQQSLTWSRVGSC